MKAAPTPLIKVVGISGSGKSTLVRCLREHGYDARPVSQEHSDIPDLWQHFERPYALIYLSVNVQAQKERRPHGDWTYLGLVQERNRLASALDAADIRIDTSRLSPEQVCEIAIRFLNQIGVTPSDHPLGPIQASGSATKYNT